jgi:hypothetical protein
MEWIPGVANLGFAGGTICDRCTDAFLTRSTRKETVRVVLKVEIA